MALSQPVAELRKDSLLRSIVPGLGREQVRALVTRIERSGAASYAQELANFFLQNKGCRSVSHSREYNNATMFVDADDGCHARF